MRHSRGGGREEAGDWHFVGDQFADSFNPRRAILSEDGRLGYLKLLNENTSPDPWIEQWANEQIISELAVLLESPSITAEAGSVEGQLGAVVVFMEGHKVSELRQLGFDPAPVLRAAQNRDQFGLIVALDVWTMNIDRGEANLFFSVEGGRPLVRLIDHGHTLLLPRTEKELGEEPQDWPAFVTSGRYETPEGGVVSRVAIGSQPTPEQIDRPIIVFIETPTGVVVHRRDEPAPRTLDAEVILHGHDVARPGQTEYFDAILDSFSTSCLIRTVAELDPELLSAILVAGDQTWEALPRPPAAAHVAA